MMMENNNNASSSSSSSSSSKGERASEERINSSANNADSGEHQNGGQSNSGGMTSLFQQHFFQPTNGAQSQQAMNFAQVQMGAQHCGTTNPAVSFAGSNEAAMHAFAAAAAANNLGLLCAPPNASVPHSFGAVPSGTFPSHLAAAVGYGQRVPPPSTTAPLRHQMGAGPLRKSGPSSLPMTSSSASAPSSSVVSASSVNRSQRCGVCRGCQCKPCGQCTYCQDSPQFGGPGVKKQSCIERRCLRVLENRLQRDAPTFKARVGCNACEDCRSADCQICLVCLDKRFFNGRYMCGALCAKKRCNNATSLELPISLERSPLKRTSDHHSSASVGQQMPIKRSLIQGTPLAGPSPHSLNSNIARILSAAQDGQTGTRPGSGFGSTEKYVNNVGSSSFGRSSGGNSTTNSPVSENGTASGQSETPPSSSIGSMVSSNAHQMLLGRSPLWHSATAPSQMLVLPPHPYSASFDQMASLAAAAAAGFPPHPQQQPQHFQNQHHYYQPKFLNYPKYEYFDEGTTAAVAAAAMINGGGVVMGASGNGAVSEANGPLGQGGNEDGGSSENPFVPPSYSAKKVVLQDL